LFVCLFVLHKNFRRNLHKTFEKGWQWANEQLIKFGWRSGSPSVNKYCFPDSSLLGGTESGINRLRCATLQCRACTSRHRHSNYDVISSLAHDRQQDWYHDTGTTCLGGGMPCPSASSLRSAFGHVVRLRSVTHSTKDLISLLHCWVVCAFHRCSEFGC